jgi:hypothetical protein
LGTALALEATQYLATQYLATQYLATPYLAMLASFLIS